MKALHLAALALPTMLALAAGPDAAAQPRPDALLVVDRHREAIIERTLASWPAATAERREALRATLWSLRADELLSASLLPDDSTLAAIVAQRAPVSAARARAKALGDPQRDLVYTPVTPCRIADTRVAGGALAANQTRTLLGYHASSFAAQGGTASSCGLAEGVSALAVNVVAVNPAINGYLKLWAASTPVEPTVSTLNYEPPTIAIATGAIVPVDRSDSNKFNVRSPAVVHVVVDVVGYFSAPLADGPGLRISADATFATVNSIDGSAMNHADAGVRGATVAGGGTDESGTFANRVNDHYGTVGGGVDNQAGDAPGLADDNPYATVAGGISNTAGGLASFIGGGNANYALGWWASVVGGIQNQALGSHSAVSGGSGNVAFGDASIVLGGSGNEANGDFSTAGGSGAIASQSGMFVWADPRVHDFDPAVGRPVGTGQNTFNVRATGTGGVWLVTGIDDITGAVTWGCYTYNGAGWSCTSDRAAKRNLDPVDGQAVLETLAAMPIYRWQPRQGPHAETLHMGPTAQDFHAAFGLGGDARAIGSQDIDGVALAAIQGLNAKLEARLAEQAREIEAMKAELAKARHVPRGTSTRRR